MHTAANTSKWMAFFIQLKSRNKVLYYYALLCLIAAICCMVAVAFTNKEILGINAWIKPTKFFLSTGILSCSMGWYMIYLEKQRTVKLYTWLFVVAFSFENIVIVGQAARGQLSHFNISTPLNGMLFAAMGIVITIITLYTLFICFLFFQQQKFPIGLPAGYIWGIRLGLLFFVLFAFEGGQMAARLAHTYGAPDGGEGLPFLNWSKSNGDLRVAHFFGMHALQVLPLAGFYFAKTKTSIVFFSIGWLLFTGLLYWQAILGYPLLP